MSKQKVYTDEDLNVYSDTQMTNHIGLLYPHGLIYNDSTTRYGDWDDGHDGTTVDVKMEDLDVYVDAGIAYTQFTPEELFTAEELTPA